MITVNAMGDACPIPVVKTKNAIRELGEAGGVVETLVDNEIAGGNLTQAVQGILVALFLFLGEQNFIWCYKASEEPIFRCFFI